MPLKAPHLIWTTPTMMFLILLPVPSWGLEMQWVPTSVSVFLGEDTTIPCNFDREPNESVKVSWVLIYRIVNATNNMSFLQTIQKNVSHTTQNLTIRNAKKHDSGLYRCSVTVGQETRNSCGTYLRVKEPASFLFFNVAEATKNRLITAEGIILLLCAIIPGTFLLYKRYQQADVNKRIWEAYSTAGKAIHNDYTSLTAVELLAIQGVHRTI
ncbi:B-cell antigen receptor complex-associated protein alpha chain isoform X2 [Rhinoderma darwinii]|uniref:B-cell antigen receptor complex-associated protein alpha chain isoform X2 n=1 Tax=Rhinoderma darwinii TaxID=43563 RepID=UPI003F6766D9